MMKTGKILISRWSPNYLDKDILGYVVVVICISLIINFTVSLGIYFIYIGKIIGISLMAIGIVYLYNILKMKKYTWHVEYSNLADLLGYIILVLLVVSLFLTSLAPPTDADSLDYHLGVPVDWLTHGGAYPRLDWNHARLVGLGEAINLFGLVNGTDNLGQLIQYSGLWVAYYTIRHQNMSNRVRLIALLLIFSVPLNLFLSSIQKPQLFQAALIFYFFINITKLRNENNHVDLLYVFLMLFYAIGSKIAFLFLGGLGFLYGLYYSYINAYSSRYIQSSTILFIIILLPIYLRGFIYYGDPISPMLEFLKEHPSIQVLEFSEHLRTIAEKITINNILPFLFGLMITLEVGKFSTVMGIGILIGFFQIRTMSNELKLLFMMVVIYYIFNLLMHQTQARYYIEGYWIIIFISLRYAIKYEKLILGLLSLQGLSVLAASIVGATLLFPGSLSSNMREQVMMRSANGYAEAKWINEVVPDDKIVIAETRSHSLIPREFVSYDMIRNVNTNELEQIIVDNNISSLFLRMPLSNNINLIKKCKGISSGYIKEFNRATRNPFNSNNKYKMVYLSVNIKEFSCNNI